MMPPGEITAAVPLSPIGIAGAGRLAQAAGYLLQQRGYRIAAIASRSLERAQAAAAFLGPDTQAVSYADLPQMASRHLIAVSDEAIGRVAGALVAGGLRE